MKIRDEIYYFAVPLLFMHKVLDLQVGTFSEWNYFQFEFEWTRACDHAGLTIYAEIFGLHLIITLHDVRHWDYDKDDWVEYEND